MLRFIELINIRILLLVISSEQYLIHYLESTFFANERIDPLITRNCLVTAGLCSTPFVIKPHVMGASIACITSSSTRFFTIRERWTWWRNQLLSLVQLIWYYFINKFLFNLLTKSKRCWNKILMKIMISWKERKGLVNCWKLSFCFSYSLYTVITIWTSWDSFLRMEISNSLVKIVSIGWLPSVSFHCPFSC